VRNLMSVYGVFPYRTAHSSFAYGRHMMETADTNYH